MIRSHNTKAGSFSCAGEKFSTLAEAVAFVESPEAPKSEKMSVGFRFRKRIRLGKGRLNLGKRAPRSASAATARHEHQCAEGVPGALRRRLS
jgi:hypothetical protein